MSNRYLSSTKIVKGVRRGKGETKFPTFTMPNRILFSQYAKIVKGGCIDKRENLFFKLGRTTSFWGESNEDRVQN